MNILKLFDDLRELGGRLDKIADERGVPLCPNWYYEKLTLFVYRSLSSPSVVLDRGKYRLYIQSDLDVDVDAFIADIEREFPELKEEE